jgi:hypothetical protein
MDKGLARCMHYVLFPANNGPDNRKSRKAKDVNMKKVSVSETLAPLKRQLERIADGKSHLGLVVDSFSYPDVVVKAGKKILKGSFCLSGGNPAITFDGKTAKVITKGTQMADFRQACIDAGLKGVEIRSANATTLKELVVSDK